MFKEKNKHKDKDNNNNSNNITYTILDTEKALIKFALNLIV